MAFNEANDRYELSMYLLNSLDGDEADGQSDFWTQMSILGQRCDQDVKAYGRITALEVRDLAIGDNSCGLDLEVNNTPHEGLSDVIGWNDCKEARIEQTIELGKKMKPVKRPSAA